MWALWVRPVVVVYVYFGVNAFYDTFLWALCLHLIVLNTFHATLLRTSCLHLFRAEPLLCSLALRVVFIFQCGQILSILHKPERVCVLCLKCSWCEWQFRALHAAVVCSLPSMSLQFLNYLMKAWKLVILTSVGIQLEGGGAIIFVYWNGMNSASKQIIRLTLYGTCP
jgi:hypothetical protein